MNHREEGRVGAWRNHREKVGVWSSSIVREGFNAGFWKEMSGCFLLEIDFPL